MTHYALDADSMRASINWISTPASWAVLDGTAAQSSIRAKIDSSIWFDVIAAFSRSPRGALGRGRIAASVPFSSDRLPAPTGIPAKRLTSAALFSRAASIAMHLAPFVAVEKQHDGARRRDVDFPTQEFGAPYVG